MNRSTRVSIAVATGCAALTLLAACGTEEKITTAESVVEVAAAGTVDLGRDYWKAADIDRAEEIALANKNSDAGKHLLADVYAVTGNYQDAAEVYASISTDYEKYRETLIDNAVVHAVHLKDISGAKALAEQLRAGGAELDERESARLTMIDALDAPMEVVNEGSFEVPFDGSHPYNPWMPVVAGKVNGQSQQLLFDTGGSYLVITEKTARELGIEWDENSYFEGRQGHSTSKTWVGVVDSLELSDELELVNVPAIVLQEINTGQEMIIFGTTILKEFLSTVDTANQKFVLTSRSKPDLVEQHRARYPGATMDFVMVGDHYMLAKSKYNGQEITTFWDSGLVVVGAIDGQPEQCWMNMTPETMEQLGVEERDSTGPTTVTATDDVLEFAGMAHDNARICVNPGKKLSFGGIDAEALIGYGAQKKYAWTIDFDNMEFVFTSPR